MLAIYKFVTAMIILKHMRFILGFVLIFCLCATARADYELGRKHQVRDGALYFDAVELFFDGKFVGLTYADAKPIRFSNNYYVFAVCPLDKLTNEPNGYCSNWMIYDVAQKSTTPLVLPGHTIVSVPSFFWPYIAYLKIPKTITEDDFSRGYVEATCIVVEWPKVNVVAKAKTQLNVHDFETETAELFSPPKFTQNNNSLEISCLEPNGTKEGKVVSTLAIPTTK